MPGCRLIDRNVIINRRSQQDYDNWLNGITPENDHNPNPFDFVLLKNSPQLFNISELESSEVLYSGYMIVKMNALTPVHIVGKQIPVRNSVGRQIWRSCFYKEDGSYVIPGSSIRGMLRSFIEALTNGWVSQAQEGENNVPAYKKEYTKRHLAFDSFRTTETTHRSGGESIIGPAIPPAYKPDLDNGIDIASFMFGIITEKNGITRALKHRVSIGDALVNQNDLINCNMVDIQADAFMGGPRPSASNWWYMMPSRIMRRQGTRAGGGCYDVYEFIGEGFWGRKFYFHQKPDVCINFYLNHRNWPSERPVYQYSAQCLSEGRETSFRIDFRRLPEPILNLLCLALVPGEKIKHKIGYGKQYGYGSIDLSIEEIKVRDESKPISIDGDGLDFRNYNPRRTWKDRNELVINNKRLIDEEALIKLARILTWAPNDNIIFTYPPRADGYFKSTVRYNHTEALLGNSNGQKAIGKANSKWSVKRTIHFLLYQWHARKYKDVICRRTP